ncbi:unnamed protein product [Eruca vesicaria subsp. sativa]|uniref:Uncharacterized protein n=1 Tax=Eruca vesicaria subsp. sativa TaxID=29727 RepID=A0ABC8KCV9_ERUVS|nr:unnamed protein product [Eruca vesicaria subsp. sativa]
MESEEERIRKIKGKAIATDTPPHDAMNDMPIMLAHRSTKLTISEKATDPPPQLSSRHGQRYVSSSAELRKKPLELVEGLDQDLDKPLSEKENTEVDRLVLETKRLEMDENMIDFENDDLLGDSPDFDAEKIEAIFQLSPANSERSTVASDTQRHASAKAPAPEPPRVQETEAMPSEYVPKGLLKKKTSRSPDEKGTNA